MSTPQPSEPPITLDKASLAASSEPAHKPFIAADQNIAELTLVPLLVGSLLGIVFGASSLYLVLKVGLTVSASIPVAVLSITIFRALGRATILENNIVQTTGSAGESIAFGVGVTMPALLILGYNLEFLRVVLVAVLGGLLGILMMIPLRRALIVNEAKTLIYPEGTACAEVLIVGEKGGTTARTVFGGFFAGGIFKVLYSGLHLFKDTAEATLGAWFKGGAVSMEVGPELLGVGYIIGTKTSNIMAAGGILSSLVLIPAIKLFGDGLTAPLYPGTKLISEMDLGEIWHDYVLYIGVGAVATGGIISLGQSMPTIVRGALGGLKSMRGGGKKVNPADLPRTDRDLPMKFVLWGALALVVAIWRAPGLEMNLVGALLIVALGFLFVTVSSRLTGEIGSSSNPISGMTVATLLITSLVFVALGWTSDHDKVAALSVAAVVCIAASNGGTTSQDLKTGYLVGATPAAQQIAILVGALTSSLVIGGFLLVFNDSATVYAKRSYPSFVAEEKALGAKEKLRGPDADGDAGEYRVIRLREPKDGVPAGKYLVDDTGHIKYLEDPGINGNIAVRDNGQPVQKFKAPKAALMSFIIDGIMSSKLPWGLVLLGVFISVVLELCGISALPFAVGVYLPISTSTPIWVGGVVRWLVERSEEKKLSDAESESSPGVLASSGLIAGGAIGGTVVAFLAFSPRLTQAMDLSKRVGDMAEDDLTAVVLFLALAVFLFGIAKQYVLKGEPAKA